MHFAVPFYTTCNLFSYQRISMLYTVCLLPQWTPSQSGLCLLKSAKLMNLSKTCMITVKVV